ncbi:hypothetical protein RFI_22528 [Reticulomyxa filosa]|uniref:Uncharacterized protein n=1 Tax=Reticulomyxa filosa TaxID=46433 RepID=X6MLE5_RETFI|nr:hypothetical protein RFI_22528 [Reticulomyxa filosa]|eukprot:ETO14838.1 hypothetical protein RFI_22528 [Reticulomyxa filosa]
MTCSFYIFFSFKIGVNMQSPYTELKQNKLYGGMNECNKQSKWKYSAEKEIKIILDNWIRLLQIKLGWINDLTKLVAQYAKYFKQLNIFQGHPLNVTGMKFSPDMTKIVSSSFDKTIRIWEVESGKEIQKLELHPYWVKNAQFSPDGAMIVACTSNRTIRLWNARSGQELHQFGGHSWIASTAQFSSDGQFIVSCSKDKTIRIWNVKLGKEIKNGLFP